MSELKVYLYKNCGTCRKAKKFLDQRDIKYKEIPIRTQTPTREELKRMLDAYGGAKRKLFNTAGVDYRNGGYKERLATMSDDEALTELAANGNLIKRPFVISSDIQMVGFNEEDWESIF